MHAISEKPQAAAI
jgi:C1A family cysteine protease